MNKAQSEGFYTRCWRGRQPMRLLFWRDMLAVGSLINLGASFLALMLVAQGAAAGIAVAVHFAPLPYNVFLLIAIWRSPQRTRSVTLVTALWFTIMAFA